MEYSNDPFARPKVSQTQTTSSSQSTYSTPSSPASKQQAPVYNYDEDEASTRGACLTIAIIFVVLALAGFGIWYYLTHRSSTKVPPTPPTKNGTNGTKVDQPQKGVVSAKDGGTVTYKDPSGRTAKIIVPPGALRYDTKLSMEWVSYGPVTDLYHLKPDGIGFLKPVTVVIPYKESGLKKDQTPYDIQLEYWFKNTYGKTLLDFSVDRIEKTLSAKVDAF